MNALLYLLLPPTCPGCGREGALICSDCGRHLAARMGSPPGLPIGLRADQPEGIAQLEWCAPFTGPTRAALHELKYAGNRRLAEPLGALLAARWRRAGIGGEVLVPVPIHAQRLRERGYDQADLLARAAARHLALPVAPALTRGRRTVAMHDLGRAAREANVVTAFVVQTRWRPIVEHRWIVLIDDITTTGATLAACAAALHAAGAAAVSALTVARER